jgi:hypothetical protein
MTCARTGAGDGAAQNSATWLTFQEVRIFGGNQGIVTGGENTNSDNPSNSVYDQIRYQDCYHNSNIVGNSTVGVQGTSFFIGVSASGGR